VTVRVDRSDGRSLRSGFVRNAATRPSSAALAVGGDVLTYAELDDGARRHAAALCSRLDRAPRRVGILAARSRAAYTGTLAALYAGATYVPLNPKFPRERLLAMVRSADVQAIVTERAHLPLLESLLADVAAPIVVVCADGASGSGVIGAEELERATPLRELPPVLPHEPAYLLFTSGSTGTPKGVAVTHSNVLHFIDVVSARYGFDESDRFSQTFDQTFDLSVFDLFCAWENGARVCVPQPIELLAPGRYVERHELTVWFSVPSVPALMRRKNLLRPGQFPTLRWSLFCGEPLPVATADEWAAAAPNSVVENLYGPTELTIACLVHRWSEASREISVNGMVPIGRPLPGLGAILLDEELRPVPEDGTGELCVSGPQTVPGYWRDRAKTEERFITVADESGDEARYYRTGDRVRRQPNGDYVFIGRMDHQVKVLGHRVELGEIEAALLAHAGVTEAAVVAWPIEDGSAQGVVAFVCGADPDADRLKEAARARLPDYMVPRAIHVRASMPLNANGKIDRNALRALLESGAESA
jgi:amino acid adenylation domain-containing protein